MQGTLRLSEATAGSLRSFRARAGAAEACGLLLAGLDGAVEAVETVNGAPDPSSSFLIAPEALLEAAVSGRLLGCWHTHPSGSAVPSPADHPGMRRWPDLVHVIVGRTLRAWRWSSGDPIEVVVSCGDGRGETPGLLCSAPS